MNKKQVREKVKNLLLTGLGVKHIEGQTKNRKIYIDMSGIDWCVKHIDQALTQAHQEGYEEAVERIKKAIINEVKGVGELWFPCVGVGDATPEEELEAAENFADNILTKNNTQEE